MQTCFVIMPISTPETLVQAYDKDADHFSHVLDHLFIPAIERAAFSAIPPKVQGADVIHADIIKNLETADLVLCDISSFNPNVFFELGCRTALNKPVCYVMDDLTRKIPFDTGIINHHTYSHLLAPWNLDGEIERLSAHITASAEGSRGKNMLWQYFGLQSSAHAPEIKGEGEGQLAYLIMQVEAIRNRLDEPQPVTYVPVGTQYTQGYGAFPNVAAFDYTQFLKPDWDGVIAAAENDLLQIGKLRKEGEWPPSISDVKSIIENHLKSLSELIEAEPTSKRAGRALDLQSRYSALLLGK